MGLNETRKKSVVYTHAEWQLMLDHHVWLTISGSELIFFFCSLVRRLMMLHLQVVSVCNIYVELLCFPFVVMAVRYLTIAPDHHVFITIYPLAW